MGIRQPKDVIINGRTLKEILIRHSHWVAMDCDEDEIDMRANLSNVDLSNVDLHGADLTNSELRGADLTNSELRDADLGGANLSYANLCSACLRGADLIDADLHAANLFNADLRFVNMCNACLSNANLINTDLIGANLIGANLCNAAGNLIEYRRGKILTEDIVGYKQCRNNIIVTLQIPKGAIVFSINGNKCRTNKAKVIAIDGAEKAYSIFNSTVEYKVGEEFDIQDFNCEYNEECAEGIHFFMTREKAEKI